MALIKVWVKKPGEKPVKIQTKYTLEALQKIVGGYIETVTIAPDLVVICNEEGRIRKLPYNCTICGIDFVGPIIIAGVYGDEFGTCPVETDLMKRLFPKMWM